MPLRCCRCPRLPRPVRKAWAHVKNRLIKISNQKVILLYPVYNAGFCAYGLGLTIDSPSWTHVGSGKLVYPALHIVFFTIGLLISIFGAVACILRSVRLTSTYILIMPGLLAFGFPSTWTMSQLHCLCDEYQQCDALRSWIDKEYAGFVNPWPPAPTKHKFDHSSTVPFTMPPGMKDWTKTEKDSSLTSVKTELRRSFHNALQDPQEEGSLYRKVWHQFASNHTLPADIGRSLPRQGRMAKIRSHEHRKSLSTLHVSAKGVINGPSMLQASSEEEFRFRNERVSAGEESMECVNRSQLGQIYSTLVEFHASYNLDNWDNLLFHDPHEPSTLQQRNEALQPKAIPPPPGATGAEAKGRPPPPPLPPGKGPPKSSGHPHQLQYRFSNATHPSHPRNRRIEREKVYDHAIDPVKQKEMSYEEWLEYISAMHKKECTCTLDTRMKSCHAYQENPGIGSLKGSEIHYWCKIDKKDKEACLRQAKKSRGEGARIKERDLFPIADDPDKLWTRRLCEKKPMSAERGHMQASYSVDSSRAKCKCVNHLGVKLTHEERARVRPELDTEKDDKDVLVGFECQSWFKEDAVNNYKWCIVGFDTACADRSEIFYSEDLGVRLFRSSIPCIAGFRTKISEGEVECRNTQLRFKFFDWTRYAFFPFFLLLTYFFSKRRCADPENEGGQWSLENQEGSETSGSSSDYSDENQNRDSQVSEPGFSSTDSDQDHKPQKSKPATKDGDADDSGKKKKKKKSSIGESSGLGGAEDSADSAEASKAKPKKAQK